MNSAVSTIGTSDAARLVATEYEVGTPSEVRLMNSGVNDTYAVVVGRASVRVADLRAQPVVHLRS